MVLVYHNSQTWIIYTQKTNTNQIKQNHDRETYEHEKHSEFVKT